MAFSGDEAVKSAERVFRILEWFEQTRVPCGATDIARAYEMPVSSTIALLKSMANCRYLAFDPVSKTYFPTICISRIGKWLDGTITPGGPLRELVEALRQSTGQTVTISCQNDLEMLFVAVDGNDGYEHHMRPGEQAPLFSSAVGLSALSRHHDRDVRKLVSRYNRWTYKPEAKIAVDKVIEEVKRVRALGYCAGYDLIKPNVSAIAWPVAARSGVHGVIVGIGGETSEIKTRERDLICAAQSVMRSFGSLVH